MAATLVHSEATKITPELARKWLGQNTAGNRNISKRTVEAYTREMIAGRWLLTHQGIAFNRTGELVDGQHRLHAVVASNATVTMMVTTGLPLEFNSPIDHGYGRTLAHLTGKSTRWVGCVRGLLILESGQLGLSFKATVGSIEECFVRHEPSVLAVLESIPDRLAVRLPTSMLAALAYAWPINPPKMKAFADQLASGEMLKRGYPALSLRAWHQRARHSVRENLLATLAASRAILLNRELTKLTAGVTGGAEREGFSNYQWIVGKRRAMGLAGTPGTDVVAPTGGKRVPGDAEDATS
jgi:hypothetical protein